MYRYVRLTVKYYNAQTGNKVLNTVICNCQIVVTHLTLVSTKNNIYL